MKKKLLFIIESFAQGGAERALLDIVNHLDSGKFDITIISLFRYSVFANYKSMIKIDLKPGIRYRYLVDNRFKWLYVPFNYFLNRFPASVFKLFIGDRYDVVIAFYEGAPTRFVSKARLRRGKKLTWLQTSVALSQKDKREEAIRAEGETYKAFARIVALSRGVADSFSAMFPELKEKLVVAYHPMDISAIVRKGEEPVGIRKPAIPLLVSVGRMTWAKAYDRYLRIINTLKTNGLRFEVWIIGGGDRSPFEKYCKEFGLDNVRFFGNLENPYPYMKLADWLVLPSYVEGFGTVSMEALALGKPVLATRCSGTEELLGDSEYGIVVDNSETALQAGLERILSDPRIKARYEGSAQDRARLFDIDACITKIETILYV